MPIINLQKRSRELGRIRLGQKGDRGQPQKLDRFRFTSHSQALLTKIAELYGGDVREWTPAGGTQQWEVISGSARVPIMVPPQPVSQWYEFWTRAGCQHRCDGQTNVLTDEPCNPEDPKHLEAIKKPTTRLNVVLRDVEGIGVWRVESHGFNAAIELPDVAEFLAQAGGYVNGWLALEQRTSIEQTDQGPKTRHYAVPIIEVDVTPAQLMAGGGRIAAPALSGGPVGDRPALAAAGPDYVAMAADLTSVEEVRALWKRAQEAGHLTQGLDEHLKRRAHEITAAGAASTAADGARTPDAQPDADGAVEAEIVEDQTPAPASAAAPAAAGPALSADEVWAQIMQIAASRGLTTTADLEADCATFLSISSAEATAEELAMYLDDLRGRPEAAA